LRRIQAAGGRAIALTADVTDPQAVEHLVAEVEHQVGAVDILVNNAGQLRAIGSVVAPASPGRPHPASTGSLQALSLE
jgi:NAD(P)-dependent dehydrogenase (short-subunit alcohol dehydrogenase family)